MGPGGGKAATIACTLVETAKHNSVNLQTWPIDTLGRIADHKITRIDVNRRGILTPPRLTSQFASTLPHRSI